MPKYAFTCEACGWMFNEWLSFADASKPQSCPRPGCGGESRKIFTAAPIHFKGDGWGGSK